MIADNVGHPEKQPSPRDFTDSCIVIDDKDLYLDKKSSLKDFTNSGIGIDDNDKHPEKQ
jgi:hypothetical protein